MALKRHLSSCSESDIDYKKLNTQATPEKIMAESNVEQEIIKSQFLAERDDVIKKVKQDAPDWFASAFDLIIKDLNYTREHTLEMLSCKAVCEEHTEEIAKLQSRVCELEKKNSFLEDNLSRLEDYSRRNNLIIRGIPEEGPTEDCRELVIDFLRNVLEISNSQIAVVSTHRLGKPPHTQPFPVKSPRNIILKLGNMADRDLVWKQRFKLKGSRYVLLEDFGPTTQNRRSKLQPYFHAARKHPDVKRCHLNRDTLWINGQRYSSDSIKSLSFDLSCMGKSERKLKSSDGTVFFGKESFLSNFYDSPISDKHLIFQTAEHYFQYKKAMYFNDQVSASAILAAKTPKQAKAISHNIKDLDEDLWQPVAEKNMLVAVTKKFEQNPTLRSQLIATTGQLIEANPKDTFFSCGLSIDDPNIEIQSAWKGLNVLGNILCQVRDHLSV